MAETVLRLGGNRLIVWERERRASLKNASCCSQPHQVDKRPLEYGLSDIHTDDQ